LISGVQSLESNIGVNAFAFTSEDLLMELRIDEGFQDGCLGYIQLEASLIYLEAEVELSPC
jgi:hypothetical protein